MSRVKQVKIQDKESLENFKEIATILDQLTGMHDKAEPEIVLPKIAEVYNYMAKFLKSLNILVGSKIIKNVDIYSHNTEIEQFVATASAELDIDLTKTYTSGDFIDEIAFYKAQMAGNEKEIEKFAKEIFVKYQKVKDSDTLKHIVATCGSLKPFEDALLSTGRIDKQKISEFSRYHPSHMDKKRDLKPDWGFVERYNTLMPLSFAKCIDFKFLWIQKFMDKTTRKFLVEILFNLYFYGSMIFDVTTSPDIDTKKLSQLFIEAIQSAKKRLPGFDQAFKVIESATSLLERRFNDYYRDSVRNNKNSVVFVEDFIFDLANESTDAVAKAQLKRLAAKLKDMITQSPDYKDNQTVQALVKLMDGAIQKTGF